MNISVLWIFIVCTWKKVIASFSAQHESIWSLSDCASLVLVRRSLTGGGRLSSWCWIAERQQQLSQSVAAVHQSGAAGHQHPPQRPRSSAGRNAALWFRAVLPSQPVTTAALEPSWTWGQRLKGGPGIPHGFVFRRANEKGGDAAQRGGASVTP